jgi:hypothetical protein
MLSAANRLSGMTGQLLQMDVLSAPSAGAPQVLDMLLESHVGAGQVLRRCTHSYLKLMTGHTYTQVVEVARTMSDEAMQLARQAEAFLATDKDMPEAEKQLALQVQEVWTTPGLSLSVDTGFLWQVDRYANVLPMCAPLCDVAGSQDGQWDGSGPDLTRGGTRRAGQLKTGQGCRIASLLAQGIDSFMISQHDLFLSVSLESYYWCRTCLMSHVHSACQPYSSWECTRMRQTRRAGSYSRSLIPHVFDSGSRQHVQQQ